jgi:LPS sulfotransferase NodH
MNDIAILFGPRSGSTWLCEYITETLHANGIDIMYCGEFWSVNKSFKATQDSLICATDHSWSGVGTSHAQSYDTKVQLFDQFPTRPKLVKIHEHRGSIDKVYDHMTARHATWIVLERINKFNAMVSHLVAGHNNLWHARTDYDISTFTKAYTDNKITIDIPDADEWFTIQHRFIQKRKLIEHDTNYIGAITYENLYNDTAALMPPLLKLAGIANPIILDANSLDGLPRKIAADDLKKEMVSNYDELYKWYKNSKWFDIHYPK